jgi:tetratricopeptide (TPR) repeat protein
MGHSSGLRDYSLYWAPSGWDLNHILESEAPIETLQEFIDQNPSMPQIRLVRYSLAVRLTRENRYDEAAEIFQQIKAIRRAPRLRQLAALYSASQRSGVPTEQLWEARYKLAEFLIDNSTGVYFNDALWNGLQRYAFTSRTDWRLTRDEREALTASERKLKDDQEERWRAYLILRDVVRDARLTPRGQKAARLALRSLNGINTDRFEREEDIRLAAADLIKALRGR